MFNDIIFFILYYNEDFVNKQLKHTLTTNYLSTVNSK